MDVQVQEAIEIAWDPRSEQSLKAQAFDFLNNLRQNPTAWSICLSLFTRDPRKDEVIRHVSLEVVNNAIHSDQLDTTSLSYAKDSLLEYVRRNYSSSSANSANIDSTTIQNKLAQTLTYLFESLYKSGWESFFDDLWQLAENEVLSGQSLSHGTLFYLRIVATVHDEIADVLIQASTEKSAKDSELKDLVRVRDASKIATRWEQILSKWRAGGNPTAIQLCLKTISRWVSWTDINLIVTQSMLNHLFEIATEHEIHASSNGAVLQNSAIDVFTDIVAKKMATKEKMELLRYLNVERLVGSLVAAPALSTASGTPSYDTDLAETVAKLVNNIMVDLIRILDSSFANDAETLEKGEQLLQPFMTFVLRFFSDEFDEVCSTVIPAITELLIFLRKLVRIQGSLTKPYDTMLTPILDATIAKMRYDDTSSWGEEDEQTDEAEFQELRKRLRVVQQTIATIDETLYINNVTNVVESVFNKLKSEGQKVNWRDLDLTLAEMYLLGELATKNGGLYQKKQPSSTAAARLIQMMSVMAESDLANFPHPAIHLQYMEISVRYSSFFQANPRFVTQVLENFVRFAHSDHPKVKTRSWYLFLRYVRQLKLQLANISVTVIQAFGDLLEIRAELKDNNNDDEDDDMSSNQNAQPSDTFFNSQLYLFEAVGCVASVSSSVETQISLAQSTVQPLVYGVQQYQTEAASGDEQSLLQIHHYMMALGTLAKGFSDWIPGKPGVPVHEQVSDEFYKASNAMLTTLGELKRYMKIRSAARFAFSRMIGVLGVKILQQLPQWIDGFLAESSTREEMATFLKLLDQVIFSFKGQIIEVLDTLLTPMLLRVFGGFREEINGTDDEIQHGELRREYLQFLLVLLDNNLEAALVSSTNQGIFDTIITTIEHFAKETTEHQEAKLAMGVLIKMCSVWGGPDIPNPSTNDASPAPSLVGFDGFMLTRFSALTWSIMSNPDFNPREPQSNRVVGEIASLQQTILRKTGREYLTYLREIELRNLGASDSAIEDYVNALVSKDSRSFKNYLAVFLQRD